MIEVVSKYTEKGNSKFEVRYCKYKLNSSHTSGWSMAFYNLRLEYALEGSLNYIAWKDRMEAVLEDNGLKDFIDQEIPKPTATNVQDLA